VLLGPEEHKLTVVIFGSRSLDGRALIASGEEQHEISPVGRKLMDIPVHLEDRNYLKLLNPDLNIMATTRVGMNWQNQVEVDQMSIRLGEVDALVGDPTKATKELKWHTKTQYKEIAEVIVDGDTATLEKQLAKTTNLVGVVNPMTTIV
jgi:GDP-D-mannose dehydratase